MMSELYVFSVPESPPPAPVAVKVPEVSKPVEIPKQVEPKPVEPKPVAMPRKVRYLVGQTNIVTD